MRKKDLENYLKEQAIIRRIKEHEEREWKKKLYELYPWRKEKDREIPRPIKTFF